MRPVFRPTAILLLLLTPALLSAQTPRTTDPSDVIKELAGQWRVVSSRGEVAIWTIEEDGRYRTVFRQRSGQEIGQTGKISVTPQGEVQSLSDKGAAAVLTLDRDSSGAQVLRGKGKGLLSSTFEGRRIHPSSPGQTSSEPIAQATPSTKGPGQGDPRLSTLTVSPDGPLDLVGIKVGMLVPAAIEALKAHDPQVRFSVPKDQTMPGISTGGSGPLCIVTRSASFWGVAGYVGHIFCQHFDNGPDIESEVISLELIPSPSSPEVVTGIYREVRWRRGKERAIDNVVASLKQKYGDYMVLDRGESVRLVGRPGARLFSAIWHYDSNGTAVHKKMPSCQQEHPLWIWGGGASTLKSPPSAGLDRLLNAGMGILLSEAKGCDSYVFASWIAESDTPTITGGITMTSAHAALRAARANALLDTARTFEEAQKRKQAEDALKRRDKF